MSCLGQISPRERVYSRVLQGVSATCWRGCLYLLFPGGYLSSPSTSEFKYIFLLYVCLVTQSYPTLYGPTECSPPGPTLCLWGFSREKYASGWQCPPPLDLPNPEIEPRSPTVQVYSLPSELPEKPFFIVFTRLTTNAPPGLSSGVTLPGSFSLTPPIKTRDSLLCILPWNP